RDRVVLHWRAVGDVPRSRSLAVAGERAVGSVGPVDAALDYWVSAPDGAVSDTFRATPRDPLLVTGLTVDVLYPGHVGRAADRFEGTVPPLSVPEGTVLRVAGRTTRPLIRALLRRVDGEERGLEVVAAGFRAEWRLDPGASGSWEWRLQDSTGPGASVPDPLELAVESDRQPGVRIVSPGPDTLLPASLRQPIVAEATDDHGIAGAALVLRPRTASGRRGAPVSVPLPTGPARERALIRGVLDASSLDLVPGDAVEYHVEVRDNSPAGRTGRSATQLLRLPGMAELRDRAREAAGDALEETRRLAEEARELEAETRNASRKAASRGRSGRSAGSAEGGVQRDRLDFEAAAEAAEVASRQAEVLDRVEALRDRVDALRRALDEAGMRDPETARRLDELRERLAELASPELRAELQRLQDAVETLDPEAVKRALERLADAQESLREEMERSVEQMQRAAAEQELAALTRQAEEIAARQEALADAMEEDLASPAADSLEAGTADDAPRSPES
ncbi:MAG: hypothetical protein GWM90_29340, partial [Gemmatimonadetes bacterium]|nr:hypothetical protein [Gemmatimonadota bacterium]NIQ59154.1 hypothetical protein [Gemmatimonadota bacterium]NIU79358.1 hypothetical protein [Gammaproteobacteria bacterium]NIX48026.1 hypothetical protein [Gemmatimonadota bacterium]NIY12397.1 hypothetical protein [Gemmatimonadota bacterium]